jgi:hypothetical protein
LDPDAIFAKTAKGREEITKRTHGLPQRLRTLLVIVDGQTTAREHREKCKGLGDVAGMLAALAGQGFIADVREKTAAAPASRTTAETAERSLEAAMRFGVDRVLALLGPDGDMLTERLEAARTRPALVTELERCRTVLEKVAGAQAAERFWSGVSELLPD